MRTVGSLVAALFLSAPAVAQRVGIDVKDYLFSITIPDSGSAIRGHTSLYFERGVPADSVLTLDLVGMTVDSVLLLGAPHEPSRRFTYDGRMLRIPVQATYALGLNVVIWYHGSPQDGLIIGLNARGRRVAFADNWPERARFWLPVVDHPSDKATAVFSIEAPSTWRVIANGAPASAPRDVRGWIEAHPIPAYTMVIGGGEFTVSKHRPVINGGDAIPIEVWTYAEDSAFADSVPFRRATEIVEVMQRLIGALPLREARARAVVHEIRRDGELERDLLCREALRRTQDGRGRRAA